MKQQKPAHTKHRSRSEAAVRAGILTAALILLLLGIAQGGHTDVRNKAVRICYECIGIG